MALPVRPRIKPAVLQGRQNGMLPEEILSRVAGQAGGPQVRLVTPALRAWRALCAAALAEGHTLKAVGFFGSYRPYAEQKRLFLERYNNTPNGDAPKHWQGKKWFKKKPEFAAAAVPGTSNHGWALAVDTGEERDNDNLTNSIDTGTLNWLVRNEERFGFSHELQSEPWHIRYFAGDDIPAAVRAFEETMGGGADMPLTEDDTKRIADATWFRDTDPSDTVKEAAWVALHNARRDAAAALHAISALRADFNVVNNRDVVEEQEIANGLLGALSPTQIVDAILEGRTRDEAAEIADGLRARLNPEEPQDDE